MRMLEVRRHSIRGREEGLSQEGERLAAAVAPTMSASYAYVVTSEKVRARETAEAMGFPVDTQDAAFSTFEGGGLGDYFGAFRTRDGAQILRSHAESFVQSLRGHLTQVPAGGRMLVISHGGAMEQVAALFAAEFTIEAIGGPFAPCEGFSLHLDDSGAVVALDLHRLVR